MDVRKKFPIGMKVSFKPEQPLAVHGGGTVVDHADFEGATYPVTVAIQMADTTVEMPCSTAEIQKSV